MNSVIYLDNGATTPVDPRAADAAREMMLELYGNPSSSHRIGIHASRRLEAARAEVARAIGCDADRLTFTSGGTEANTLGIFGALGSRPGRHVVLSSYEHPSVADAATILSARGHMVEQVRPTRGGVVEIDAVLERVRPETQLCAVMWVQNEIGTVNPVVELAARVRNKAPNCHIHVDGVQALGKIAIRIALSQIDSLSLSSHKIHGPKGVGALYVRAQNRLQPLFFGGGQERGLRPGTENVSGIVAFGVAAELAVADLASTVARMERLRDRLWSGIARFGDVVRHGDPHASAPHILSVGFPYLPAEMLLHHLEAEGVYVSAGSACHARDNRPSEALEAVGVPAHEGTLRLSLSRMTTEAEIDGAVAALGRALSKVNAFAAAR
jgi:cysteine desulfurase